MSKTTLSTSQVQSFAPQTLYPFEFFDLLGLDTYNPDEIADPRRCVYGRNFRLYDPSSTTDRVALSKRQGHIFYTIPAGEAVDQQITSTTGAADQPVGLLNWVAQKFTAGANQNLTRVDVKFKNIASGTGPLIVAIYSNNAGTVGTLLATSSIPASTLTSSYAFYTARFIEAPLLASGTSYWVVCYIQGNGSSSYSWASTTSASTAMTSMDTGNTWAPAAFAMNLRTYLAPNTPVKGLTRFYRTTASPVQLMASGQDVYTVNDGTGALTSIKGSLSANATLYDFAVVNDKAYFVNGVDVPMVYDGTTVANVAGSPPVANNVEVHVNCLWMLQPNTNFVVFSNPGDYETFPAVNFLYIPSPKTADPVIKMVSVQGVMYFFTRNTKYLLYGTGLTSFVLRESSATKGAVSPTAVCVSEDSTYFMSDDFHIYSFNGGTDTRLSSERVASFLRNLANTTSINLYVDDKKLYVAYTPSGQTTNQNRLVWDLVFNEWLNDEQTYTTTGINWNSQSDSGQTVLASSQVGALYFGDTGFNDLGKPIAFNWWSKYMSFGAPAAKHRVKRYYVFLQGQDGNYNVDCQVDQDNLNSPMSNLINVNVATHFYGDPGLVYGSIADGGSGLIYGDSVLQRTRIAIPGSFYKTQFRFVQSGVDEQVGIIGFSTYVLPRRPV